ncbi:hypothetical protein IWQ61_006704 [Dispira simplex]|nr:hypothetical protein IWQ61_006704 [Dispira simplex]
MALRMLRSMGYRSAVSDHHRNAYCLSIPAALLLFQKRLQSSTTANLRQKYNEKLKEKAQRFGSVEEMIAHYKRMQAKGMQGKSTSKGSEQTPVTPMSRTTPSSPSEQAGILKQQTYYRSQAAGPTGADQYAKSDPETIRKLWIEYHTHKGMLAAVIPEASYEKLYRQSQLYPRFVFPIPHGDGVEVYYAQFHYHQCFFTPLLEYKTHGESAKPYLTLSHYTELRDTKGIVLMRGELASSSLSLSLESAQLLALMLQQFYLTGSKAKRRLVEEFNASPHKFDFNRVLEEANKLD